MSKSPLSSQRSYAEHRKFAGLPGGTQAAVHRALKAGRISYAPGTSLIDAAVADRDWEQRTEPRPQFPARAARQSPPAVVGDTPGPTEAFLARQAEPVTIENVVRALHDAYAILTKEYQNLCSGLTARTELMTVGDLDMWIDEVDDRLDHLLAPCICTAFTGKVEA